MRTSRSSPRGSFAASRVCSRAATQDVEELAARIVRRVTRLLARRDAETTGDDEVDALAQAHAEAVQPPLPHVEPRVPSRAPGRHRCALVDGFSLHANTAVDAADRAALERLARYLLRPLISTDRLTVRSDGRVEYRFRRPIRPAGPRGSPMARRGSVGSLR
jgi:hypothetical protein